METYVPAEKIAQKALIVPVEQMAGVPMDRIVLTEVHALKAIIVQKVATVLLIIVQMDLDALNPVSVQTEQIALEEYIVPGVEPDVQIQQTVLAEVIVHKARTVLAGKIAPKEPHAQVAVLVQ